VEEITWKAKGGLDVKGGLYYPVEYVPGKKYPVVIQTHGWRPDKFMIDGPFPTGFAAQALAGKGIMVVQADAGVENQYLDTPKEAPAATAAIEGLIDYLDCRGLIDLNRVGLLGFSRTVYYAKYVLTHSKYHFAATSIANGFDGGYVADLLYIHPFGEYEGVNGGLPFGDALKAWVERSPGFSVDKVESPVRIVSGNLKDALFDYSWFSASTLLGKPIEMVVIHNGEHYLRKPWERMIASQGNVDWFCFWLKGEEDTDPCKSEQYARWHELRKTQIHNSSDIPRTSSIRTH
jgi:dipeptidyl aminopeptidase/acylaminoacyl peptidase